MVSLKVVEGGLGPLAVLVGLGHSSGIGHDLVLGLEGLLFPGLLDKVLSLDRVLQFCNGRVNTNK